SACLRDRRVGVSMLFSRSRGKTASLQFVSRARRRPEAGVWPVRLRDLLPLVPVPLANGDPDVQLDLKAALDAVYDRAGYDYLLDYGQEVEPPLSEGDAAWAREIASRAAGTQGL